MSHSGGPTESPTPPPPGAGEQERGGSGETFRKRVNQIDSLVCYEVTDDELTQLEQGSPDSVKLNLAIALLSMGFATVATFFNAKYENDKAFLVFLVLTIVALVVGVVLLGLFAVSRRSKDTLIHRIRKRGPETPT